MDQISHSFDLHPDVTRGFPSELPRLKIMLCALCWGQGMYGLHIFLAAAQLALHLKLSFPVSRMWQRWVRRSSKAVVILASPTTLAHLLKLRLMVMTTLVRS